MGEGWGGDGERGWMGGAEGWGRDGEGLDGEGWGLGRGAVRGWMGERWGGVGVG